MNNSAITLTKIMAINTKINQAKEAMRLSREHNNHDLAQSFRGEVFGMQDTLALMLDMSHAQLTAYLKQLNQKGA